MEASILLWVRMGQTQNKTEKLKNKQNLFKKNAFMFYFILLTPKKLFWGAKKFFFQTHFWESEMCVMQIPDSWFRCSFFLVPGSLVPWLLVPLFLVPCFLVLFLVLLFLGFRGSVFPCFLMSFNT